MTAETQQRYGEPPAWSPARPKLGPIKLLVAWLVATASLLAAAWVVPGAHITTFWIALLATAVIGILNAILPPLVAALRLPLTLLLGFVLVLVLDALMLLAADRIHGRRLLRRLIRLGLLVALVASGVASGSTRSLAPTTTTPSRSGSSSVSPGVRAIA